MTRTPLLLLLALLLLAAGPLSAGGVLESTDGGASWTGASAGLPREPIASVAVEPGNPAVAYAVADDFGGLYKTADGGASWTRLRFIERVDLLAISPSEPGTLYAASSESYFRSTDHGVSWNRPPGRAARPGGRSARPGYALRRARPADLPHPRWWGHLDLLRAGVRGPGR